MWPCQTAPLALCDWRSTAPEDFAAGDVVTPVWEGESFYMHHNPGHEWWFARDMRESDVVLIKMFDSEAENDGSDVAMC